MTPVEQHDLDQKSIAILADAVTKAMNENVSNKRFIDLERIPLICLSIANISRAIDEIKEMIIDDRKDADEQHKGFVRKGGEYLLIRSIVFGGVALILLAFAKVAIDTFIK